MLLEHNHKLSHFVQLCICWSTSIKSTAESTTFSTNLYTFYISRLLNVLFYYFWILLYYVSYCMHVALLCFIYSIIFDLMLINARVLHHITIVNYYKALCKLFFVSQFIYDVAGFKAHQLRLLAWPLGAAWWSTPAAAPEWRRIQMMRTLMWTLASKFPCTCWRRDQPWQASSTAPAEEEFNPGKQVPLLKKSSTLECKFPCWSSPAEEEFIPCKQVPMHLLKKSSSLAIKLYLMYSWQ